jgi:hypothetical protein
VKEQPLKQSIPKASPVKVVAKKELAAQLISDLRDTVPVKTKQKTLWNEEEKELLR